MRRKARVDENQLVIVARLRRHGATVVPLHTVGEGVPDLLVGFRHRTFLVEVKTPAGRLTDRQKEWHESWNGDPVCIIRTVDQVDSMMEGLGAELNEGTNV